jgi:hypothetical protein
MRCRPPLPLSLSPLGAAAQRPHVLFTLASEVLALMERLGDAEAWRGAKWANEIFLQIHLEADVAAWRARIGIARGSCWLITGIAHADEVENVLGHGDGNVLLSEEAEDTRVSFSTGESVFFLVGRGSLTFLYLHVFDGRTMHVERSLQYRRAKMGASVKLCCATQELGRPSHTLPSFTYLLHFSSKNFFRIF